MTDADRFPLTAAQAGIWAGQALVPRSPGYTIGEYVVLDGDLVEPRFVAALRQATAEAPALWATFPDEATQLVGPAPVDWPVPVVAVADEAAALVWMRARLAEPIDPRVGPLFAHALLRLTDGRRIWFQRFHHIALDGYGIARFSHRVAELYNGHRGGGGGFGSYPAVLAEDLEYRASPAAELDRRFWADYLVGLRPTDPAAPALGAAASPLRHHRRLPPVSRAALVARTLAAVAVATDRRTQAGEAILGLPVANRLGAAARVPCLAMNIVPLRLPVSPLATLATVQAAVAAQVRLTRPHRRYRYEQLRRDLGLLGGGRRLFGPVVNVMPFNYRLDLNGIVATAHNLTAGPVEDLVVSVADRGTGLTLQLDAHPDSYTMDDLVALGDELADLIQAADDTVVGAPATFVEGAALPASPRPVVESISRVVATQPQRIALVTPAGAPVRYDELWIAAQGYAERLRTVGVGPGHLVAVSMPAGADAIAALLGVLVTGAGYLPLDPHGPEARRQRLLERASPAAIVSPAGVVARPGARLRPAGVAYVMFTSGSTGTPNPVAVGHAALAHFVAGVTTRYAITGADRVLQFAPLHFDASVEEIFPTLCAGATLVLRSERMMESMPDLVAELGLRGVTMLDLPTAFWHELAYAELPMPASVRAVVIGGETALPERVGRWRRTAGGHVTLFNTYGPTEATVVATVADLTAGDDDDAPIGRPLPGVRCAIVRGELYLLGGGLADGYLDHPHLTRVRFGEIDGAPAYRTGDRVEVRPDGQLDYLGRIDGEFKLSGHRVDPAEIESVLLGHPDVVEVAVVGHEFGAAKHLTAFVVGDVSAAQLRRLAEAGLPRAVVPSRFEWLDRLPRTPNGKIDRAGLRRGDRRDPSPRPLSPAEQSVAKIWAEVLGIGDFGPEDNIFDLGGQSLQTIQVANRLGVTATTVFAHPTVASLAAAIEGRPSPPSASTMEPVALPDGVGPVRPTPRAGRVLLTGGTGFVGVHLLAELLRTGPERVACLVRAADAPTATARLLAALHRERLSVDWDRIDVVVGDLAAPYGGPPVDAVYHCAAVVSVARDYASLRATNVDSTARLLTLSRPFHYVSTMAGATGALATGYQQSKAAAEDLVQQAHDRGLPAAVYRLGRVVGATGDGGINPDDLAWRVLRAGLPRGVLPAIDVAEPWTPVDWVARTLVALARGGATGTHALAPAGLVEFDQVASWVRRFGFAVETMPLADWCAIVRADANDDDRATLAIFEAGAASLAPSAVAGGQVTAGQVASGQSDAPAVDEALMRRYLTRAVHDGWIPHPRAPRASAHLG